MLVLLRWNQNGRGVRCDLRGRVRSWDALRAKVKENCILSGRDKYWRALTMGGT